MLIMNFLYCFFILFSASLQPETQMLETIRQDKYLAAGNHHTYIAPDKKCLDTKAPRGYKPFYIG